MNKKQVSVLLQFFTEGVEFFATIKDAKEDGKISIFEWFKIVRESGDVFGALKDLKGFEIESITDSEIEEIVDLILSEIDREVNFTRDQAIWTMNIAKYFSLLIESSMK